MILNLLSSNSFLNASAKLEQIFVFFRYSDLKARHFKLFISFISFFVVVMVVKQ